MSLHLPACGVLRCSGLQRSQHHASIGAMLFADMNNDFVFRRIFATHPDILRCLLDDLLERSGEQSIESVEYLPSEQLPLVPGFKLSILDVRCRDRSGATFIVEMQLVHVPGFDKRVVYNASKVYADQLKTGEPYTKLQEVVAISICDFDLWPDKEQRAQGLPMVPMLSRYDEPSARPARLRSCGLRPQTRKPCAQVHDMRGLYLLRRSYSCGNAAPFALVRLMIVSCARA